MSILKSRIRLRRNLKQSSDDTMGTGETADTLSMSLSPIEPPRKGRTTQKQPRRKIPGGFVTPEKIRCAKNIAKNYGRAISNFATSEIAKPYLEPLLRKQSIEMKEFLEFMRVNKRTIKGIDTFRALLLYKETDDKKLIANKKIFQEIGIIFIKYFSVNWIFTSKIVHKLTYLKFRFKVLRRIQNPELFTYIKG